MLLGTLAAWPRWRWTPANHDRVFAACVCAVTAMAASRASSEVGRVVAQPEATVALATLAMLAITYVPIYSNASKRRMVVAAYRLLVCWLLPPGSGQAAKQLGRLPAAAVVDTAGVMIGASSAGVPAMLHLAQISLERRTHGDDVTLLPSATCHAMCRALLVTLAQCWVALSKRPAGELSSRLLPAASGAGHWPRPPACPPQAPAPSCTSSSVSAYRWSCRPTWLCTAPAWPWRCPACPPAAAPR